MLENDTEESTISQEQKEQEFFFSDFNAETDKCNEFSGSDVEEKEMLTSSLLALTSHFAQVQFRLRQIVKAPLEERDNLLKSLEEFAFRGIPEVPDFEGQGASSGISSIEQQRLRQHELIQHLKSQLEDLEKYAFESGEPVLPQAMLVEKQKVIIDELKNKINLNFDETVLPHLSPEDLRNQVDSALGEFVSPLKMKDQLVSQLKTQIVDLERFIAFIQNDEMATNEMAENVSCDCISEGHRKKTSLKKNFKSSHANQTQSIPTISNSTESNERMNQKAYNVIQKVVTILDMFAVAQFGCSSNRFQKNTLKKTTKGNHWGDIRAQLEVDIQEIINFTIASNLQLKTNEDGNYLYLSDSEDGEEPETTKAISTRSKNVVYKHYKKTVSSNVGLTSVVRKKFAVTLQNLMQHGLSNVNTNTSVVPFISCFAVPKGVFLGHNNDDENEIDGKQMHVWELILEYYYIKNGDKYNETPARRLSQSFNLDIVGGTAISIKQSLLSTIGSVIATHAPYKRSYDSHFKAFVCAGLNSGKLVKWLHLIFQCTELINTYYRSWSYVANTGFRDALRSMESLSLHKFDLPVDIAVRQFQNINDVFM